MLKYEFSIQTRDGLKVPSVVIAGRDQADAERKLFQMYRQCTVLQCESKMPGNRPGSAVSLDEIYALITR